MKAAVRWGRRGGARVFERFGAILFRLLVGIGAGVVEPCPPTMWSVGLRSVFLLYFLEEGCSLRRRGESGGGGALR